MATIAEIRQKYPQYSDMSDSALADALHQKFYSDMPRDAFNSKVGLAPAGQPGLDQKTFDERFTGEQPKGPEPFGYQHDYPKMKNESLAYMKEGVDQLQRGTIYDAAIGAGKTVLGGVGYVASPISAALRTTLGRPLEHVAGIPREYTEFAASLALPMPKRIPTMARAETPAAPTVEQLKASYRAAKESPEVAAVSIKPEALVRFSETITPKLDAAGLDGMLAPKTHHILSRMTSAPEGSAVTMANVDSARRLLGKMAGRGDEEAAAAQIAKRELDRWMMKVRPDDVLSGDPAKAQGIMQAGRADYTAAKLGEALDSRLAKAEAQADASHSGMNLQNQLRQKVNQFLSSGESRSLSTTERAELEGFVKGTIPENALRYAGKFLGGGGGLGALTAGSVGTLAAGPAGIAAPVVGYALTKISNRITANKAGELSELLRSRSPLAQQLTGPMEDFGAAIQAVETSPTARNLSRALIASRNLSHNLKDAGITVSPNDLLKSIAGPTGARAENE
jgi:hypothetical protein